MRRYLIAIEAFFLLAVIAHHSKASQDSIGPNGINSSGLAQKGGGIDIGQVELFRPGDPTFDSSMTLFNSTVDPNGVFWRRPDGGYDATPNVAEAQAHAVEVAGLMISTDAVARGVAPEADLFSVGINPTLFAQPPVTHEETALAANHLATLPEADIRAINMSINVGNGNMNANGTSKLTSFIDWSAGAHEILYVVAGTENQGQGALPLPADNFNGLTVGYTFKSGGSAYDRVDPGNVFTMDDFWDQTSVDLVAPGRNIQLATQGNAVTPIPDPTRVGTSLAAPHITGTAALLQQLADNRISANQAGWDADARRHEVMKAVLMNSADKTADTGNGQFLGMEKTILDTNNNTWLASEAYSNPLIPLDDQMGTGQLNAKRAMQQFQPGESDSDSGLNSVPRIGWDYGHTSFEGDFNRYLIDVPLVAGDFVSITLAWDREVELTVDDGGFNAGDTFVLSSDPDTSDDQTNDLDLFLVPLDSFTPELESGAFVGTSEHIFAQIPFDGEYEIWVQQQDDDIAGGQDYGLAWWYGLAPPIGLPDIGDFDGDGDVDGDDEAHWEGDYAVNDGSDADGDGDSDGVDFLVLCHSLFFG